ncbi:uncharacterized protein LOC123505672 isoform X2 [Portunus trituberculatus]|uniref:uncharacterized protein LOC123505672 isoform X1 n=1 Tax=Portunus trituberculatus TaxID=210409 RepID=UPI001E1CDE8D|nr:uncharacterized protein LOC123505672 isoform X1 [Portunus trituberculatus]XP_045113240.1 uncharacterized protein LOC123505672 isoform X2 [Portunus trituberculatus]
MRLISFLLVLLVAAVAVLASPLPDGVHHGAHRGRGLTRGSHGFSNIHGVQSSSGGFHHGSHGSFHPVQPRVFSSNRGRFGRQGGPFSHGGQGSRSQGNFHPSSFSQGSSRGRFSHH